MQHLIFGQLALEPVPAQQNIFGIFFKGQAGKGQLHGPVVPDKKSLSHRCFKALHRPCQRGRGNVASLAGPCKMKGSAQMAEQFKGSNIQN